MTSSALAQELFSTYETYRFDHLHATSCTYEPVRKELTELAARASWLFNLREAGTSVEGRTVYHVSCGRGPVTALLWSQMHGDEPTATLALLDIFNFLAERAGRDSWVQEMLDATTLHFIPLLNPDGAERTTRQTAPLIDMNRDARRLATPEAWLLRETQRILAPQFGFNLHDQSLSSVGSTSAVAALSLLAPATDVLRTLPLTRVRAMRVGALLARVLAPFIEGHIATYDDAYEPRAFGDGMQSWGTSTLLIESGHWPADPEKAFVRKLNFVGLLTALRAIGNGSYQDVDLEHYTALQPNGRMCYDIIVRNVTVEHQGWSREADIGLMFDPPFPRQELRMHKDASVVVKEIGDLSEHGELYTVDGSRRTFRASAFSIDTTVPLSTIFDALQIYQGL